MTTPRPYEHRRQEQASAPGARGHGPSDCQVLAHEQWSPASVGLRIRQGVRLPDGLTALSCARRCWAHLAHRVLQCLAPERLQWLSNFGWGSDLIGRLLGIGFHSPTAPSGGGMLCGGGPKSWVGVRTCHPNIEVLLPYIDRRPHRSRFQNGPPDPWCFFKTFGPP